jgi:hypothetical protein
MVSPQRYSGTAKGPLGTSAGDAPCQTDKLLLSRYSRAGGFFMIRGTGAHGNAKAERFSFLRKPRYGNASRPQFRPARDSGLFEIFNFV